MTTTVQQPPADASSASRAGLGGFWGIAFRATAGEAERDSEPGSATGTACGITGDWPGEVVWGGGIEILKSS